MKTEIILKSEILINEIERIKKIWFIPKKDLKNFELKVFGIWELNGVGYSVGEISKIMDIRIGLIFDILACLKNKNLN